jgi:tRNA threonylcarbamoyladenosine biosynthesis protein TsaB
MNILAFDSSLNALSVAVARRRQDAWQVSHAWEARSGHAERLLPMIGEVMAEAGMAFSAIDRIGVTVGPGSFTGVRVGVAAARGLALALKRPAIGFTNLAVMAHEAVRLLRGAHASRLLAVVIDAGDGMHYFQLFEGHNEASPPLLLAADAAAAVIGRRPVMLVGSGADAVATAVATAGGAGETALIDLLPRAPALALLAESAAAPGPVRPLYLRPHGAKPMRPEPASQAPCETCETSEAAFKGASAAS